MKFHRRFIKKIETLGYKMAQTGQQVTPGQENQIIESPPLVQNPDPALDVPDTGSGVDPATLHAMKQWIIKNESSPKPMPNQWYSNPVLVNEFYQVVIDVMGADAGAEWFNNVYMATENQGFRHQEKGVSLDAPRGEGEAGMGDIISDPSAVSPDDPEQQSGTKQRDLGDYEKEDIVKAIDTVRKDLLDGVDKVGETFEKMTSELMPQDFNPYFQRREAPAGVRPIRSLDVIEASLDSARSLINEKMDSLVAKANKRTPSGSIYRELTKWNNLSKFVKPAHLAKQMQSVAEKKENIFELYQGGMPIEDIAKKVGATPRYVGRAIWEARETGKDTWSHYRALRPEYQPGYTPKSDKDPPPSQLEPRFFSQEVTPEQLQENNAYVAQRLKARLGEKWEENARPIPANKPLLDMLKKTEKDVKQAIFGPGGWLPIDKGFLSGKRPMNRETLKNLWEVFLGQPMPPEVQEQYNKKPSIAEERLEKRRRTRMAFSRRLIKQLAMLSNIQRKITKVSSRPSSIVDEAIRQTKSRLEG